MEHPFVGVIEILEPGTLIVMAAHDVNQWSSLSSPHALNAACVLINVRKEHAPDTTVHVITPDGVLVPTSLIPLVERVLHDRVNPLIIHICSTTGRKSIKVDHIETVSAVRRS